MVGKTSLNRSKNITCRFVYFSQPLFQHNTCSRINITHNLGDDVKINPHILKQTKENTDTNTVTIPCLKFIYSRDLAVYS